MTTIAQEGEDAREDGPLEIHYKEPAGRNITHEGEQLKCYSAKEYKKLGKLIIGYHSLWDYTMELEEQSYSAMVEVEKWQEKAELWKEAMETQELRIESLTEMFDAEHKLRLSTYNKQSLSWVPWTLVAIESILLAALGTYSAVQSIQSAK